MDDALSVKGTKGICCSLYNVKLASNIYVSKRVNL